MTTEPTTHRRRLKRLGAIVLVLALAAAVTAWLLRPAAILVETGSVQRGPFTVWVEEEARTRVQERHGVHAPVSGRLQRLEVKEGDRVAQGAVIAQIDPALPNALDARARSTQQATVSSAQAALEAALAHDARAQAAVAQAQADLERSTALAARGFIAPSRAQAEGTALEVAQRERDAQQAMVQSARHELQRARAALTDPEILSGPAAPAAGRLTALRVVAPVSGVILRRVQADASSVLAGALLLEMADLDALEVTADLLTTQATQIRTGQTVALFDWGSPTATQADSTIESTVPARVERIEPGAFTKVSALGVEEQRVRVVMRLNDPAQARALGLGDGWRVQARIEVRHLDDAIRVPVQAIFPQPRQASGSAVFVVSGGRAQLRAINLIERNATHVAISSGLQPGETVVLYPPSRLRDGDRIQAEP